ncbi:MAG: hypothetical protein ACREDR_41240 [Blastocatellia bacterium]
MARCAIWRKITAAQSRFRHSRPRFARVRHRRIFGVVMGEARILFVAGVVVGAGISLAAAGSVKALLFGIAPYDPLTLICASALLVLIAGGVGNRGQRGQGG